MTRSQPTGRRTGLRRAGFAVTLAVAASLAACGPADTGLPPDTARQLQERVLGVSQSVVANDHPGALRILESLEADLTTAVGTGQISEERRRSILTSITAVRAELTAAVDAAAAAAAAKAAEEAAAAEAEKTRAEAEAEAASSAARIYPAPVVAAPLPEPPPAADQKKGNEGKGKKKDS